MPYHSETTKCFLLVSFLQQDTEQKQHVRFLFLFLFLFLFFKSGLFLLHSGVKGQTDCPFLLNGDRRCSAHDISIQEAGTGILIQTHVYIYPVW